MDLNKKTLAELLELYERQGIAVIVERGTITGTVERKNVLSTE